VIEVVVENFDSDKIISIHLPNPSHKYSSPCSKVSMSSPYLFRFFHVFRGIDVMQAVPSGLLLPDSA
jgi:hypothetical protein